MYHYYKLNENVLFRIEFFGGLVINRKNFQRMELSKDETIYLKALEKVSGNSSLAYKIASNMIREDIDIHRLIDNGIILEISNSAPKDSFVVKDIIKEITIELDTYWNRSNKILSAPLEVVIYPTLNCNLGCKFCFIKNKNIIHDEINAKEWLKMLNETKRMGVLSISILGGEPTKYKEIEVLLKGIEVLDINTTMTSNGVEIADSIKEILIHSKHIIPVFSIQSFSEKNKDLMGISYQKTLETVEYMLENKKEVRINSVYTNQNVDEFCEIIDYCISNKIKRYSIGAYVDINKQNTKIKNRSFAEIRILDEQLQKYISNKYGEVDFVCSVEGCLIYSAYPELENDINELSEFEQEYFGCRAGRTKLEIYPNGDVFPCICFENKVKSTSNILNNSLREIWHNDKFINALRDSKTLNSECITCGYNIICNSGCPAIKYDIYGVDSCLYKDPRCYLHHI